MVQMGTYEELIASSLTFAQLLEDINQHVREQRSVSFSNQLSINSEKQDVEEEDVNPLANNAETKQEGTVKWTVYVSYFQAGVGVILGVGLIVIIFAAQQAIDIYSNWWLAAWSNDEGRRYQNMTSCMNIRDNKTDKIHKMNDIEWNAHRAQRYYIFSG
jgi:hypothetical protein